MSQHSDYLNVRITVPSASDLCDCIDWHLCELINLLGASQILIWYEQQDYTRMSKEQITALILLLIEQRHSAGSITLPAAENFIGKLSTIQSGGANHELTALLQDLLHSDETSPPVSANDWRKNAICSKAIRVINTQYRELTLESTASALEVNPSYLSSSLARNTGASFLKLLHCRRILAFITQCTCREKEAISVENIAFDIGYNSPHHFWRVFKQYTGISPSMVKKLLQNNAILDSFLAIQSSTTEGQ